MPNRERDTPGNIDDHAIDSPPPCRPGARRLPGARRRPRHRAFRPYPDPALHGGGPRHQQIRSRPDRVGELPRLPARRSGRGRGGGAGRSPPLAVGRPGAERPDDRRHGPGRFHDPLPDPALHGRRRERTGDGLRLCPGPGPAVRHGPARVGGDALCRRRRRDRGFGPGGPGRRFERRRLAASVAGQRAHLAGRPCPGMVAGAETGGTATGHGHEPGRGRWRRRPPPAPFHPRLRPVRVRLRHHRHLHFRHGARGPRPATGGASGMALGGS